MIEKIPPDYKVEFAETKVRGVGNEAIDEEAFDLNSQSPRKNKPAPEAVETSPMEMKNCIQTIYTKRFPNLCSYTQHLFNSGRLRVKLRI